MGDARVFQEHVETAVTGQTTDARLYQELVEAAVTGQTTDARLYQHSVEVAVPYTSEQYVGATGIASAEAVSGGAVRDASIGPRHDTTSFRSFIPSGGAGSNTTTHTPVGVPRGVVVQLAQIGAADDIAGVTYGGVEMQRIRYDVESVGGETGQSWIYFLGSGIPSGPQSLVISWASPLLQEVAAWCSTLLANGNTEIAAHTGLTGDPLANPSATLATAADFAGTVFAVMFHGDSTPSNIVPRPDYTPLAGSNPSGEPLSSSASAVALYGRTWDANIEVGWTAPSDDVAMSAVAVRQVTAADVILVTAIPSGEGFGTPTIPLLAPTGIGSAENFGTPIIQGTVYPTGIVSRQAFGTPALRAPHNIRPTGIPSVDQPGSPSVSGPTVKKTLTLKLQGRGIKTAEAFGTPKVTPKAITPPSITSGEAVGTPLIVAPQTVTPTGIASAESVPAPRIARPETVVPDSIPTQESFGTARIVQAQTVQPPSIDSAQAFGTPTLTTLPQTIQPVGVETREAVGLATIIRAPAIIVAPSGIPTALAFGQATVIIGGPSPIQPSGIGSTEAFGLPFARATAAPGARPLRRPMRLYDAETGVSYAFAINPTDEEARAYTREYEAGAPGTLGLTRQQAASEPQRMIFRGTILDPAQKTALDSLYTTCDQQDLTFEDYTGDLSEVIITSWDCRPERAYNPRTRDLVIWRYTLEMHVLTPVVS